MTSLKNKSVFITGASSGIGEACARIFAENDCSLFLAARREERLKKLSDELHKDFDVHVEYIVLDVRQKEMVFQKLSELDHMDILVNNAGLSRGLDKLFETDIQAFEEVVDTNVKGLFYVSQAIIPKMLDFGSGDIINISSIAGHEVYPGGAVYCASKHAVDALTKGLRIDLVDTPLRVSAISPGMVETEFSMVRFYGDKERASNVYKGLKPLTAEDIAELVFFIASRPAHVQIGDIVVFPTNQASATISYKKNN